MRIEIKEAISKKDIKSFIDFAHELYKDDPLYVPELYMAQKEMFDKKKYPFYEYGQVKSFLAYANGKIVGRISAIDNPRYNDYHKCNVGFFGFFDAINDQEVANALLNKAADFAKINGNKELIGPTNFTTNETAGLLVQGYEQSNQIMMTYNASYYADLIEAYGLTKEMDLYAYFIPTLEASDKSIRLSNVLEKRLAGHGITIRNINTKDWNNEVERIKKLYNSAWDKNWGFVPFTDREFQHLAEGLKLLVDSDFAYMAEDNGIPVGFSVSLPNINEITKGFKKGRLFPFNIIKLLLNKKKVTTVRIASAGVIESHRKKGIEAIFFAKNIQEARKRKLKGGEASWVLESNKMMIASAEKLNGKHYKTYRLYKKAI